MPIPQDILDLLRAPSLCFVTTLMKDGSPQTTETWVDTDGEHVEHCVVDAARRGGAEADEKVREASEAIARLVRS